MSRDVVDFLRRYEDAGIDLRKVENDRDREIIDRFLTIFLYVIF